ncbi:hypothetical protein [Pseudomaricurvus hydrocarbonicus]|uniref:hypothetical protein n=1 Tax=Pseudomaricurvus hydrocarbonicus TaxID=1470433 RepID=UPI001422B92C|nr:hypothetical protein [Aestuariicella hydrocarbonica]
MASQVHAVSSRYDRTVEALQSAPREWRQDFASIALLLLTESYYVEAGLAEGGSEALHEKSQAGTDQSQWRIAVERYAGQLHRLQISVDSGADVSLLVFDEAELVLEINHQQVMLSHPRMEKQPAFEQSVLEQFCQVRDCYELTGLSSLMPSSPGAVPVPDRLPAATSATETVKPAWSFTVEGLVCAHDGIRVAFQPSDNPGAVRKLCVQLFTEAGRLLSGLAQQQSHGVLVDWSEFALSGGANGTEQVYKLNGAGDVLRLNSPLMGRQPAVLTALQPWLRARLRGRNYSLELPAGEFGWKGATISASIPAAHSPAAH